MYAGTDTLANKAYCQPTVFSDFFARNDVTLMYRIANFVLFLELLDPNLLELRLQQLGVLQFSRLVPFTLCSVTGTGK
jgi:hypothetical protein